MVVIWLWSLCKMLWTLWDDKNRQQSFIKTAPATKQDLADETQAVQSNRHCFDTAKINTLSTQAAMQAQKDESQQSRAYHSSLLIHADKRQLVQSLRAGKTLHNKHNIAAIKWNYTSLRSRLYWNSSLWCLKVSHCWINYTVSLLLKKRTFFFMVGVQVVSVCTCVGEKNQTNV